MSSFNVSSVAIIGSGNVAYHFAQACAQSELQLEKILVRADSRNAKLLREFPVSTDTDLQGLKVDLVLIAVSDDAIGEVADRYSFGKGVTIAHTSGAVAIDALARAGIANYGCVYPLQTMSHNQPINYRELPLFIEGSNDATAGVLSAFSNRISDRVFTMDSTHRLRLHLASTFANNFSNHMMHIASRLLKANAMSFDLIKPLVSETVAKAFAKGPENSQTGPAIRGDIETMQKHLMLIEDETTRSIYELISRQILEFKTNR